MDAMTICIAKHWAPYGIAGGIMPAEKGLLYFYAETKNLSGGRLYNEIEGQSGYIEVDGDEYSCPAGNQDIIDADTDKFWYDYGGVPIVRTTEDLITGFPERTLVEYPDVPPYEVESIGIISAGIVLTESRKIYLNTKFRLWFLYWGEAMDSGYIKGNRPL